MILKEDLREIATDIMAARTRLELAKDLKERSDDVGWTRDIDQAIEILRHCRNKFKEIGINGIALN